ncbi:MAG: peptidoglycan-binding protein [Clostridia bacterium]|nr:peptidoglycan-binding protein [Clostridia bacterium]
MKRRKLPYIHILPRILIGVLVFGGLLGLLYVPTISQNVLSMSSVADAGSPVPTATLTPSAATFSPTPTPTATPAPTPTEGPTLPPSDVVVLSVYTTLRLGDDNASVMTLQQRLTDLGYLDSDEPGSVYNESIASAVVLFQRACNMNQTGIADSATQTSLFAEKAQTYRIKRSDIGTDVLRLQQRLAELGYYTDRINGYFGPNTEQAVMQFQAINDLAVTGELDYGAWTILYSEDALPVPVLPTDTPTPRPTARRTSSGSTAKTTKKAAGKSTSKATAKAASGGKGNDATPKPQVTKAPSSAKKTYSSVVAAAQDQLGKPYVWSAEGPDSFDCSGLVYYCLKQSGHSVSRRSAKGFSQTGSWTLISSMSELRAGDLVFFKSDSKDSVNHTGICISSSVMIHASSSKGQVVRSNLHQAYWERNFVCGRRP